MQDSGLTGLALRRAACEALGYSIRRDPRGTNLWLRTELNGNLVCGFTSLTDACSGLPAVDSDPAVSEPLFNARCAEVGFSWRLEATATRYVVHLKALPSRIGILAVSVQGSTPSEARARAIVKMEQDDE